MKRTILLILVLCLGLAGCGKSEKDMRKDDAASSVQEVSEYSELEEAQSDETEEESDDGDTQDESDMSSEELPVKEEETHTEVSKDFQEGTVAEEFKELDYKAPSSWKREGDENSGTIYYYPDQGMLQVTSVDITVPNILAQETKDDWVSNFGGAFEEYAPGDVYDMKVGGLNAFGYNYTGKTEGVAFYGEMVIFQSDKRLYAVGMYTIVNEVKEDFYSEDFRNIIESINLEQEEETEADKAEQQKAGEDDGSFKEGHYLVGTDIPAGEYVFYADKDWSGFVSVDKDPNGNDIKFNEMFDYTYIASVEDGEYLQMKRCYALPIDKAEVKVDGDYFWALVGKHLPAGTYKLEQEKDCEYDGYYCVWSDSRKSDIVANKNFTGTTYVEVKDGQYLALTRCHILSE